jgi:GNAT superfamily N-acetyltransferase
VTASPEVEIRPATAELWEDVRTVFGTKGDPSRCWCQWFRMRNDGWRKATTASNRAALREQVDAANDPGTPPPGLLAYVDGEPAGWVGLAPRQAYPRVLASTVLKAARNQAPDDLPEELDDPGVWSITCFVVRVPFRRQGVAGRLLDAAVELARRRGAHVVEGYPVDVASKPRVSSSELYHGSLSLFQDRGFAEVARSGTRPLVRLVLKPPS